MALQSQKTVIENYLTYKKTHLGAYQKVQNTNQNKNKYSLSKQTLTHQSDYRDVLTELKFCFVFLSYS
jgi:hypothetical protein